MYIKKSSTCIIFSDSFQCFVNRLNQNYSVVEMMRGTEMSSFFKNFS